MIRLGPREADGGEMPFRGRPRAARRHFEGAPELREANSRPCRAARGHFEDVPELREANSR
eukprot:8254973-Pyramimonas_sp.AAC.1